MIDYNEILSFWFEEIPSEKWWVKDEEFDLTIKSKFGLVHTSAAKAELYTWRSHPRGRLAEIIVLDQFSRNLFRGGPKAFENDSMSLALSQEAIRQGAHEALAGSQRAFLYMPFMHSESLLIQRKSLELFSEKGLEENYDFAKRHFEIIERFGRYPHRNKILGRTSTKEELEFLTTPNSSF